MDNEANIKELKDRVKNFCEERDWDQFHNAKDLAIGITTEASELLDIFRFKSNEEIEKYFKNPEKRMKICEEVSDTLFMLLRFAQIYDIDLSSELIKKIQINDNKYPVEKSKGRNNKYTEL